MYKTSDESNQFNDNIVFTSIFDIYKLLVSITTSKVLVIRTTSRIQISTSRVKYFPVSV